MPATGPRRHGGRGETRHGAEQESAVSIAGKWAVDESLDLRKSEGHPKAPGYRKNKWHLPAMEESRGLQRSPTQQHRGAGQEPLDWRQKSNLNATMFWLCDST